MNKQDFGRWLAYHDGAFPGVSNWLDGHPETVDHWQQALAGLGLDEAKRATGALLRGEDKPFGWGEHPAAINRLAALERQQQRQGPKWIDGREVFDCPHCSDSGFVTVYRPETMAMAKRLDEVTDRNARSCAVACCCSAGNDAANPPRNYRPLPVFDSRKMVPVAGGIQALTEHIDKLFAGLRTSEFDEWNEQ